MVFSFDFSVWGYIVPRGVVLVFGYADMRRGICISR